MNEELLTELSGLKTEILAKIAGSASAAEVKALQTQVDAIDKKLAGGAPGFPGSFVEEKSLRDYLTEDPGIVRLMKDKRGRAVLTFGPDDVGLIEQLQRKTTITGGAGGTVSTATTGVLQIQRLAGITPEARQQLTIRDLLTANPTTFQVVDFVKVVQPLSIASPVPEASLKPENQVTFTSLSERVRTIATWIPASRQILDDMVELMSFLRSSLPYYVDQAEELQLLTGDATGENLHGLIPQATPFDPSPLTGSWNKIDVTGGRPTRTEQIKSKRCQRSQLHVMQRSFWLIASLRRRSATASRYRRLSGRCSTSPRPPGLCRTLRRSTRSLTVATTRASLSGKLPESSATFNERRCRIKARSTAGTRPYALFAVKITTSSF